MLFFSIIDNKAEILQMYYITSGVGLRFKQAFKSLSLNESLETWAPKWVCESVYIKSSKHAAKIFKEHEMFLIVQL